MKTIEEIRILFVEAREEAKKEERANVELLRGNLAVMSAQCKEAYQRESSCMTRAKWRRMYERFDGAIFALKRFGVTSEVLKNFFGLRNEKTGIEKSPIQDVAFPNLEEPTFSQAEQRSDAEKLPPPPLNEVVDSLKEERDEITTEKETVAPNNEIPVFESESEDAEEEHVSFEPRSLRGFVGQERVVKRLIEEIAAATKLGKESLDPILLLGNRGLGKSTLMNLIARELGVNFKFIDCSSLGNDVRSQRAVQKFLLSIAAEGRPVVVGFDEIHALPRHIQTMLLTLLNNGEFSYLADNGETRCVEIKNCTFIGATTDYEAILPTLRDRCNNLTFFLKDYTREELRRIFSDKFKAKKLTASEEVIESCINRCRSSIREVVAIVKGLETKAINADTRAVSMEMVEVYFSDRGVDYIGLREKDLEILRAVEAEESGLISEETLAARTHLDVKILTKEYEPYLLKIGFLSITSRGRSISVKAKDYLRYGYYQFQDGTTIGAKPNGEIADENLSAEAEEI